MDSALKAFGLLSPLGIGRNGEKDGDPAAAGIDGFFPAGSMIRRLHSERSGPPNPPPTRRSRR